MKSEVLILVGYLRGRIDRNSLLRSGSLKGDEAIYHGKKGIILSQTNIQAWSEPRPSLSDNDGPCPNSLAARGFDPQSLGSRIPSVP